MKGPKGGPEGLGCVTPLRPSADDPLAECHAALLRVIEELREVGIAVPLTLFQALAAITWARRGAKR